MYKQGRTFSWEDEVMVQAMLELFTTRQKAEAMLANPIIEWIFMSLFGLFLITLIIHIMLFFRIRRTRDYVKETKRMDIEPLHAIKTEFDARQTEEAMKLETFIQEKFSSWRVFQIPIVNLIKMVQMTISVFILLGVLGTFIGLTISLGSINAGSDQLVENVAGVLSGIDVAFYTSIVGMSFSLIMTVLVRALNTEYVLTDLMLIVESLLESEEQYGMNRMIHVSERIHESIQSLEKTNQQSLQSIVDSFSGFKDYTAGLQQSAKDLAKFNDGLSENLEDFHELFQQMKTVTDGFSEGTTELNKNFATLFSYFQKVDRKNERITEVFEKTYEKIVAVSDSQMTSLQAFDASVATLKEFITSVLDGQADVRTALEEITNKTEELVQTMGAHHHTLKAIFGDDLSDQLGGISTYLRELNQGFDRVGASIGSLPEALQIINQAQQDNHHLLTERLRDLKDFNQTFNNHLKNHETDIATFEKHLRETLMTFNQLGTKNSELLHEINRTINQVNQTFTQRDQQVDANVTSLKDTLTTHVTNVESTLSQKLDTLIRNMDKSLYTVSDGMNRELTEVRRISEEIHQNHARLMQQVMQELGREVRNLNQQLSQIRPPNRTIGLNRDEF